MSSKHHTAGSPSSGPCEAVVRPGPAPSSSGRAAPSVASAGGMSEVMVREVPLTRKPNRYYPAGGGEPTYPMAPAGAPSDMTLHPLRGDDDHEAQRRQVLGLRRRMRKFSSQE